MKKIIIITSGLLLTLGSAFAQNWTLDKVHSRVGFAISFLAIADVDGSFRSVEGAVTASQADFSDASVQFTADANSISTDFDQRDAALKSADFFDVAKFGQVAFKSTGIKKLRDKVYSLSGDLTLHGVTKPVVLELTYNGSTTSPFNKKTVAGFKVTGVVKRSEFNIGAGFPAPALGDDVHLDANIILNAN